MDRAFLAARGRFRLREHDESLPVRRQIEVRCSCIEKLLVRPHPRLARYERIAIYRVIHYHDPVIQGFVEQLAAVVRPERI